MPGFIGGSGSGSETYREIDINKDGQPDITVHKFKNGTYKESELKFFDLNKNIKPNGEYEDINSLSVMSSSSNKERFSSIYSISSGGSVFGRTFSELGSLKNNQKFNDAGGKYTTDEFIKQFETMAPDEYDKFLNKMKEDIIG